MIPTAQEFYSKRREEDPNYGIPNPHQLMIDFAKLCVEDALKAAEQCVDDAMVPTCEDHTPHWGPCVTCGGYSNPSIIKDEEALKKSVLNAYPLDQIK